MPNGAGRAGTNLPSGSLGSPRATPRKAGLSYKGPCAGPGSQPPAAGHALQQPRHPGPRGPAVARAPGSRLQPAALGSERRAAAACRCLRHLRGAGLGRPRDPCLAGFQSSAQLDSPRGPGADFRPPRPPPQLSAGEILPDLDSERDPYPAPGPLLHPRPRLPQGLFCVPARGWRDPPPVLLGFLRAPILYPGLQGGAILILTPRETPSAPRASDGDRFTNAHPEGHCNRRGVPLFFRNSGRTSVFSRTLRVPSFPSQDSAVSSPLEGLSHFPPKSSGSSPCRQPGLGQRVCVCVCVCVCARARSGSFGTRREGTIKTVGSRPAQIPGTPLSRGLRVASRRTFNHFAFVLYLSRACSRSWWWPMVVSDSLKTRGSWGGGCTKWESSGRGKPPPPSDPT